MKSPQPLTLRQEQIRKELAEKFNIDPERVLFLNEKKQEEPWLSAEALVTIARQSENFQAIDEGYDQYIPQLDQIVHRATVIDKNGRSYSRCGIATVREREDVDDHALAAGRAVGAVLTAAGFNPLRPGGVVTLDLNLGQDAGQVKVEAVRELNLDLKQIHALAIEKGLIKHLPGGMKDVSEYRKLLKDKFGVSSSTEMAAEMRQSFINHMRQMPDYDEFAQVA